MVDVFFGLSVTLLHICLVGFIVTACPLDHPGTHGDGNWRVVESGLPFDTLSYTTPPLGNVRGPDIGVGWAMRMAPSPHLVSREVLFLGVRECPSLFQSRPPPLGNWEPQSNERSDRYPKEQSRGRLSGR